MTTRKNLLAVISAAVFMIAAGNLNAQTDEPIGPPKPVVVTNTAANPVPVTGQLNIGNTPTVDARQSGPWTVGISGTPTVKIDPAANTVSVAGRPTQTIVSTGEYVVSDGGYPQLGPFNVAQYSRIRVVAYNSSDSDGNFNIFPQVVTGGTTIPLDGNDIVTLEPGKRFSRVYDVPGTSIIISVSGNGANRIGAIAVFGN